MQHLHVSSSLLQGDAKAAEGADTKGDGERSIPSGSFWLAGQVGR